MIDERTGEVVDERVDAVTRLTEIAMARALLTDAKWKLEEAKLAHKESREYIEMQAARQAVKDAEKGLTDLLDDAVEAYQPMLEFGEMMHDMKARGIEVSATMAAPVPAGMEAA